MSHWTPVYSDQQREKIWRLRREEGLPWRGVLQECAQGDDQVAGFQIGMSSARYVVDQLDRRYDGKPSALGKLAPDDAVSAIFRRVLGMVDRELAQVERSPVGKRDLGKVLRVVKLVRELRPLAAPLGKPATAQQEVHSSALQELIAEQESNGKAGTSVGPDQGADDGGATAVHS